MKLLLTLAGLATACSALAQDTSEAILSYAGSVGGYANTTVGWTFQTTNAFTVTDLGCFAKVFEDDAAITALQVGLWNDSGTLLASNTITPASTLFDLTRYKSITPTNYSPGTYHLGVYYSGGGMGIDVAGPSTGGSVTASPGYQVTGIAIASGGGFAFPATVAGTSNSIYAGPNFQFESLPRNPPTVTNLVHGIPYTNSITAYSLQYLVVQVPLWASRATNVLQFADQFRTANPRPVTILFNGTNFPALTDPALIGPGVSAGTAVITTNSTARLVPGQSYYLALTNPNPVAITFGFGVWFDVPTLPNCQLVVSNAVGVAGVPRYFQYDAPTSVPFVPQTLSFWLSEASCGIEVVLSSHLPLPDLTNFEYVSQGPCTNGQILMFVTNSAPATRWYAGVFNTAPTNATFSIQACATPVAPVIIPLTNGVPFVVASANGPNAAPPGPPQRLFFDLLITNAVPGVLFELYNLTGDADLVLQRDVPPTVTPYLGTSFYNGSTPEQIVLRTNTGLPASYYVPDLRGHWYLGLYNNEQTNVAYTIRAILPGTNGLLIPAQPLVVSITRPAPPRGLVLTWASVVGERYLVQSTPSLTPPPNWTYLTSIVATGQVTTFEVSPVPAGSSFYQVVQGPPTRPPRLNIRYATNHQVRLSWSAVYTGFSVQSKLGITGPWGDTGLPYSTVGYESVAFDIIGPGAKYYRLFK